VAVVHAQEVVGTSMTVGPKPTTPVGSTVRLDGLATTGGTSVVFTTSSGDLVRRALATGDVPSQFTRRDVAEAIAGAWTFNAGATFNATTTVNADVVIGGAAGRRIRSDFSAASESNRTGFVSSVANGITVVQAMPNGTSQVSGFAAYGGADPANAPVALMYQDGTGSRIVANKSGSSIYPSLHLSVSGSDAFSIASSHFTQFGPGVRNVEPRTALYTNLGSYLMPYATLNVGELKASTFAVNETQVYTEASLKVGRGSTITRPTSGTAGDWDVIFTKTKFTRYADLLIMRGLNATTNQPQYEVVKVSGGAIADCTGAIPLPSQCNGVDNDDYAVTVHRNQDGSGSNVWPAGAAIVSMDRWIDIFSEGSGLLSYGNAVLSDKPVLYWTFNETPPAASPNLAAGPRGYTGPKTSAVARVGTNFGSCGWYACARTGDIYGGWYGPTPTGADVNDWIVPPVRVQELETTSIAYAWTIEFIIHTGNTGVPAQDFMPVIRRWQAGNETVEANFVVYAWGAGAGKTSYNVYANLSTGGWQSVCGQSRAVPDQTWVYLIFAWDSYNGCSTYSGYYDGTTTIFQRDYHHPSQAPGANTTGTGQPLAIVGWANAGDSHGLHFGELAIYDYQLGADAAQAHWNYLQVQRPNTINGPSVVGWVASGNEWYQQEPRWASGNLIGLYDYKTETYGFAAGKPVGMWVSADESNGFRIMQNTTTRMHANPANNDFTIYQSDGNRGLWMGSGVIALGATVSGTPNMLLRSDRLEFCIYGGACNLTMNGTTGNITLTGSVLSPTYQLTPSYGLQVLRASGTSLDMSRAISIVDTFGSTQPWLTLWTESGGVSHVATRAGGSMTIGDLSMGSFDDNSSHIQIVNNGPTSQSGSTRASGLAFTNEGIVFKLYEAAGVTNSWHSYIRPDTDGRMRLGHPSYRFANIHLSLPAIPLVGATGGVIALDPSDLTRLGYINWGVGANNGVAIPVKNHAGANCYLYYLWGLLYSQNCV
jgi:hypothetical protein